MLSLHGSRSILTERATIGLTLSPTLSTRVEEGADRDGEPERRALRACVVISEVARRPWDSSAAAVRSAASRARPPL